jgi:hypothetical protein
MNIERIKEIQQETAYPDSVSVQQALLKVWNECQQKEMYKNMWIAEPFKDWQKEVYKYDGKAIGDVIVKTCRHYEGDSSHDAKINSILCFDLLMDRKRWPDPFDWNIPEHLKCKSRLCSAIHKYKFLVMGAN